MQNYPTLCKKRATFQTQIRRFKKEETLRAKRILFFYQKQALLNTPQEKRNWVNAKFQLLKCSPNVCWLQVFKDLYKCYDCFQDFQSWVQRGLVRKFCECFDFRRFQDDYNWQNGAIIAIELTKVLIDIVCYENQKLQKNPIIASQIIDLGCLDNLIELCQNYEMDNYYLSQFFLLIDSLACSSYEQIHKKQALYLFIHWGYKIIKDGLFSSDKNMYLQYMNQIYDYFILYVENLKKDNCKSSELACFLLFLNYVADNWLIKQLEEKLLSIVLHVMERMDSQSLYKQMFGHFELVIKIVEMSLEFQNSQVRLLAWRIMTYLTGQNYYPSVKLFKIIDTNILDVMIKAHEISSFQSISSTRIFIIMCIGNMSAQNEKFRKSILKSELISIVFQSTLPFNPFSLQKTAFLTLYNVFCTQNQNQSFLLLDLTTESQYSFSLFERLIKCMTRGLQSMVSEQDTFEDILRIVNMLIEHDKVNQNQVNQSNFLKYNRSKTLFSKYHLSQILKEVLFKVEDQQVMCQINRIIDIMHQVQVQIQ